MLRLVSFWQPSPLLKKISLFIILGFTAVMLFTLVNWLYQWRHSESYFSGSNSIPVSVTQDIEFEVEPLQNIQLQKGENYFVNYRLEREKYRQQTIGMLETLLASPESKSRSEAQGKWLELTTKIEQEGELENLLKIKGFKDVVTDVTKDGVHVLVFAPELSSGDITLIQDIVIRVTKIRLDKIIISNRT